MATGVQVVFDCADPGRLARFWAEALGYKLDDPPDGYQRWEDWLRDQGIPEERWNDASAVVDPDGTGPRIYLQRVPEPKTVKNRVHLDLNASGSTSDPIERRREQVEAEVERLTGLGATRLRAVEELGVYWVVMHDPEANEFCVH
jgi:glyoxalase superfamily protein